MEATEAQRLLGLRPHPSPDAVDRAFRAAAATVHPDTGGDADQFRALVDARDTLRSARPIRSSAPPVVVIRRQPRWWDPVLRFLLGQPAPSGRTLD